MLPTLGLWAPFWLVQSRWAFPFLQLRCRCRSRLFRRFHRSLRFHHCRLCRRRRPWGVLVLHVQSSLLWFALWLVTEPLVVVMSAAWIGAVRRASLGEGRIRMRLQNCPTPGTLVSQLVL